MLVARAIPHARRWVLLDLTNAQIDREDVTAGRDEIGNPLEEEVQVFRVAERFIAWLERYVLVRIWRNRREDIRWELTRPRIRAVGRPRVTRVVVVEPGARRTEIRIEAKPTHAVRGAEQIRNGVRRNAREKRQLANRGKATFRTHAWEEPSAASREDDWHCGSRLRIGEAAVGVTHQVVCRERCRCREVPVIAIRTNRIRRV